MPRMLVFIAFLVACTTAFSQHYPTNLVDCRIDNPTDWELYVFNEDFTIEYKFVNCDPRFGYDNESVIFKITNRTDFKLNFCWHMLLHYNGECKTCDYPDEYNYTIALMPHQVLEGDCLMESNFRLKAFSKFIDENHTKGQVLTAFGLNTLKVTKTEID